MSRAFVKEGDGALDPLPDLPVSPHPNPVTPRGRAALQMRLAALQAVLQALRARADRLDRLPEAATERDIRHAEARLRSAILTDPARCDLTVVAFGLCVTVAGPDGVTATWEITGEDEADPARHRITAQSPLGRILMGAGVGDEVVWRRPAGALTLTVTAIAHAPDDPPA